MDSQTLLTKIETQFDMLEKLHDYLRLARTLDKGHCIFIMKQMEIEFNKFVRMHRQRHKILLQEFKDSLKG